MGTVPRGLQTVGSGDIPAIAACEEACETPDSVECVNRHRTLTRERRPIETSCLSTRLCCYPRHAMRAASSSTCGLDQRDTRRRGATPRRCCLRPTLRGRLKGQMVNETITYVLPPSSPPILSSVEVIVNGTQLTLMSSCIGCWDY
jgi:hypothetical protein